MNVTRTKVAELCMHSELTAGERLPNGLISALERSGTSLKAIVPSIVYFSEVTSTMDIAAKLVASGAKEGTTVIANCQTAGRGQNARKWFSPPGAGLYASIVIRPSPLSCLTMASGWLAQAIRSRTSLPVSIKWPNDLVIESPRGSNKWRKLGGVLAETDGESPHEIHHVILGFGINVHSVDYPADIGEHATSIESELGKPLDRWELLVDLLTSLSEPYSDLRTGRQDKILSRWLSYSWPAHAAAPRREEN